MAHRGGAAPSRRRASPNGFQVKVLPADADPMDIRYNVISWVHRSTRGWSYGESVIDPRTGEIIKGNVTLGSLRVRQNIMIATRLWRRRTPRGTGRRLWVRGRARSVRAGARMRQTMS